MTSIGNNSVTGGIIVETEAYAGPIDRASHAYKNRKTKRTEVMYNEGGVAYVYLCYGIHHLFNVITNKSDIPHAVLIRALEPIEGMKTMQLRRKFTKISPRLTNGPGSLSMAMGINTYYNRIDLTGNIIWIEDRGVRVNKYNIISSPRVGVQYAGKDADKPWRFRIRNNIYCSPVT